MDNEKIKKYINVGKSMVALEKLRLEAEEKTRLFNSLIIRDALKELLPQNEIEIKTISYEIRNITIQQMPEKIKQLEQKYINNENFKKTCDVLKKLLKEWNFSEELNSNNELGLNI